VAEDKSKKVLQDVVRAMYSSLFIQELFKPQEVYSVSSTKQIFEKLAHSSIMRLNKSSMDKLFDLMTMGFKYQLVQSHCPQQYLHVTLNHLESLKLLVDSHSVGELVQTALDKTLETYTPLTIGQWMHVKQTLMKFVHGKRIK
jgi:Organic solute transport protein 1